MRVSGNSGIGRLIGSFKKRSTGSSANTDSSSYRVRKSRSRAYRKRHGSPAMKGITILSVMGMAALLLCSSAAAEGVRTALKNSAGILIPSLFPFMVLSSLLMRSMGGTSAGPVRNAVMMRVFRLPGEAMPAVILSFLGGFPVGARCVRILYDSGRLTRGQACRMMCFCVCSGPAFLITGVGTLLLHNTGLGVILYLSQVFSGLIIGIIAGRTDVSSCADPAVKAPPSASLTDSPFCRSFTEAFISSCTDGAEAVFQLTAMVCIFGALTSAAKQAGVGSLVCSILRFSGADLPFAMSGFDILTEVTAACSQISKCGGGLWLFAFAAGFGGLCVHLQILLILGGLGYHKGRFFLFRLIHGSLSALIVYIFCIFCRPTAGVFSEDGTRAEPVSVSLWGTGALVVMSFLFLLCVSRGERKGRTR